MKGGKRRTRLLQDVLLIILSISFAVLLVETGMIERILHLGGDIYLLDSFIAGLFFTSAFTTPLSIAAFGEIAHTSEMIWPVAFVGGLGAVCGDYIIFRFVKDRFGEDLSYVLGAIQKGILKPIFQYRFFHSITFLIGALVIASPFPDELGITMMGLSKTHRWIFFPVSFFMNTIGILLIATVARAL